MVESNSDGDLFVYLSSDVQAKVDDAIKKSCGSSAKHGDCQNAVAGVFESKDLQLQSRSAVLIGAALLAVVGVVIEHYRLSNAPIPSIVRIDKGQLSPITNAEVAKATAIAVNDGSQANTITLGPQITSATG